jgi:phospholipase D1/2
VEKEIQKLTLVQLLIADDRVVICGSANLNDRSQLGYHDSEIAIIIEDPNSLNSYMNGQPWRASLYATTLRRQIFRKHLGLIPPQDPSRPDMNFEPPGVPNSYDFGSPEDLAVLDPLSDNFLNLWNSTARINTDVLGRIFHVVPNDCVRNWKEYDDFFTKYFHTQGTEKEKLPAKYKWGHVVAEDFPPGEQGLRQVKDMLSSVRGTLVEMPLLFLIDEDIAKEGVSLNAFTEEVYT